MDMDIDIGIDVNMDIGIDMEMVICCQASIWRNSPYSAVWLIYDIIPNGAIHTLVSPLLIIL